MLFFSLVMSLVPLWALDTGNSLPAFQLPRVQGGIFNSGEAGGKKMLIWITDFDQNALSLLSRLTDLAQRLPQAQIILISVNGEDSAPALAALRQYQLPFPVLLDPQGTVCQQLCGFFLKGVEPQKNLFVTDSRGIITLTDHLPGYPLKDLEEKLK